jgi:hypothetical protein
LRSLRDPDKRLGANGSGAEQVMLHTFFNGINWDDAVQERVLPSLLPMVVDHLDELVQEASVTSPEDLFQRPVRRV